MLTVCLSLKLLCKRPLAFHLYTSPPTCLSAVPACTTGPESGPASKSISKHGPIKSFGGGSHQQNPDNRSYLQQIGAGLSRTGTSSLKLALEQVLGGPCYHGTIPTSTQPHHLQVEILICSFSLAIARKVTHFKVRQMFYITPFFHLSCVLDELASLAPIPVNQ